MTSAAEIEHIATDAREWRRDFHRHPELLYDVHRTAERVADLLRSFGCDEVVEQIGRIGVVGVIQGRGEGRTIALRSDMDALPIEEATNLPWRSTIPGKMHACGHDGHMAMLLGAAQHLAKTRDFAGRVAVVFQPAEEGGGGGRAMVEDGLMERFAITEVYGMHNMPGIPVGRFAIRPGPIMASSDTFRIVIDGRGAHAAMPANSIDPVVVAAQTIMALQTVASRNVDPVKSAVISVTMLDAGRTENVIPDQCILRGTARALDPSVRDLVEKRMTEIAERTAEAFGAKAEVSYCRGYPVTINAADNTRACVDVAAGISGNVDSDMSPLMVAEDFSFMLNERPGALILIGNGDSAGLHNPAYEFNDAVIAPGIAYWTTLAAERLRA